MFKHSTIWQDELWKDLVGRVTEQAEASCSLLSWPLPPGPSPLDSLRRSFPRLSMSSPLAVEELSQVNLFGTNTNRFKPDRCPSRLYSSCLCCGPKELVTFQWSLPQLASSPGLYSPHQGQFLILQAVFSVNGGSTCSLSSTRAPFLETWLWS